jgi:hypothetical protein
MTDAIVRPISANFWPSSNFHLWPEQHSQRRVFRVSLGQPNGIGGYRLWLESPWSWLPDHPAPGGSLQTLVVPETLKNLSGTSAVYLAVDCKFR